MRYRCHLCGKSVTSELPNDSYIRAILVCPECIQENKVILNEVIIKEEQKESSQAN